MIVADTNVLVRGIRSPKGASGYVLKAMLKGELRFAMSPAVLFEYEDVLHRPGVLGQPPVASFGQVEIILDALCSLCIQTSPYMRFRPFLADPKDDLFVECAFASGARFIVTDDKHFHDSDLEAFGVRPLSAQQFVSEMMDGDNR